MAEREAAIDRFLSESGWADARRRLLAADASFRCYHRIDRPGETAVLMDAPPPQENVAPFEQVARLLQAGGFSAPTLLAVDRDQGFLLLEDFGDQTYTRALAEGADETGLYGLAIDLLIDLHRELGAEQLAGSALPPYDDQRLLDEAALLVDWTLPAFRGGPLEPRVRDDYLAAWRAVLPLAQGVSRSLVLRDYHVDNLMVLEGRSGTAACGLLDFQDALVGPITYDLVSLLQDARRDVAGGLAERMLARYRAAFPALERDAFEASYAVLGAQRSAKIIGIFTRLCRRDGKPQYLRHVPRVWRLLSACLSHPALAPVRDWFEAEVTEQEKQIPPEGRAA